MLRGSVCLILNRLNVIVDEARTNKLFRNLFFLKLMRGVFSESLGFLLRLREQSSLLLFLNFSITRIAGIEPTQAVLKTAVLPLNYIPFFSQSVNFPRLALATVNYSNIIENTNQPNQKGKRFGDFIKKEFRGPYYPAKY